jgi:hypothetical protein
MDLARFDVHIWLLSKICKKLAHEIDTIVLKNLMKLSLKDWFGFRVKI